MYKKITHENFVDKVKEKYGDEYEVISNYEGNQSPIIIKHNICGDTTTLSKALYLMSKYRVCPCKKCGIKQGHDKLKEKFSKKEDQFLIDIQNKFSDKILMTKAVVK